MTPTSQTGEAELNVGGDIVKVAIAIHHAQRVDRRNFFQLDADGRNHYYRVATAAIATYREYLREEQPR